MMVHLLKIIFVRNAQSFFIPICFFHLIWLKTLNWLQTDSRPSEAIHLQTHFTFTSLEKFENV